MQAASFSVFSGLLDWILKYFASCFAKFMGDLLSNWPSLAEVNMTPDFALRLSADLFAVFGYQYKTCSAHSRRISFPLYRGILIAMLGRGITIIMVIIFIRSIIRFTASPCLIRFIFILFLIALIIKNIEFPK